MRIVCVGGGPGGLYAALLLRRADSGHEVTVLDRNPPDMTYGWGVVFSDETLGYLHLADRPSYDRIAAQFVHWKAIDTYYRDEVIRSGGHAFSGLARRTLLRILTERCRQLGVQVQHNVEIENAAQLSGYDLIVAADGFKSRLRDEGEAVYRPSFDAHSTRYIWLGCDLRLLAFTFIFRLTQFGMFQVHAYPFDHSSSTFIVECSEDTWRRAGLDLANETESIRFCSELFAAELHGARLHSNRSAWITFVTLRNETWHQGNVVLLGDAAHTAHFSVGSGTKMAMEDAIALATALSSDGRLHDALVAYEELRRPTVERTQTAARESSRWFEHSVLYAHFEPEQFAFSLLTRSTRVTHDNLRLRDPAFVEGLDRWFSVQQSVHGPSTSEPLEVPYSLGTLQLPNRLVSTYALAAESELDVVPRSSATHIEAEIPAPACLLVPLVAISREARVSVDSPGLYSPEHETRWALEAKAVHAGGRVLGLQLVHAGSRGATRSRRYGVDRPVSPGWPLVAASPLPYTFETQTPTEIDETEMEHVVAHFVRAVTMADRSGIDVIDVHLGHGYLLGGFLSPLTNHRCDSFGGDLDNRLRFPLRVVRAVRSAWPPNRPLVATLNGSDWAHGGTEPVEAVHYARRLHDAGCDLIHVVSGQTTAGTNPPFGRMWQSALGDVLRNDARVPVLLGGGIIARDDVNTLLLGGRADLCLVHPD